jgi:hypothetical protein
VHLFFVDSRYKAKAKVKKMKASWAVLAGTLGILGSIMLPIGLSTRRCPRFGSEFRCNYNLRMALLIVGFIFLLLAFMIFAAQIYSNTVCVQNIHNMLIYKNIYSAPEMIAFTTA